MTSNRLSWLKARQDGIGASEASSVVGCNPWKSNIELWEEKTERRETEDISNKPQVKYGNDAEKHIRELFALDFPQYIVDYDEFGLIANLKEYPFIFATLDGNLTNRETGQKGVLEIKTTEILNASQWEQWADGIIPQHYFIQNLHQLLATGYDFVEFVAQIKYRTKDNRLKKIIKHETIKRNDVLDDLDYLLGKEMEFWEHVKNNTRPNLILAQI